LFFDNDLIEFLLPSLETSDFFMPRGDKLPLFDEDKKLSVSVNLILESLEIIGTEIYFYNLYFVDSSL